MRAEMDGYERLKNSMLRVFYAGYLFVY